MRNATNTIMLQFIQENGVIYSIEGFKPSFHMIADDRRIAGITDA